MSLHLIKTKNAPIHENHEIKISYFEFYGSYKFQKSCHRAFLDCAKVWVLFFFHDRALTCIYAWLSELCF